jgi:AcrR family transcriptional regulator
MPRPRKLKGEAVFGAALALIDRDGLDNLSMRRLGDELGVEAMSLYRHVPSKAALLDGVHEAVLDTMELPPLSADWRNDARAMAFAFRSVLRAHPNTLVLFATRPAVTTGSLRHVEHALTLLERPFPDLPRRIFALQALVSLCVGQGLNHFAATEPHAPVRYDTLLPEAFPILSSIGEAALNVDVDDEFSFALEALLVGLAALAESER